MQNNTFPTLFVGQNLIRLPEVDSTNNFLKAIVSNSEPLAEGTVIMADKQFAGRGQQENTWYSEPGMNLTFSIYLSPLFLPITSQFLLNMAVSVGVRDAINDFLGGGLKVKWPNDLYYNDQKLGGILIENILSGSKYKAGIVGIGINVNQLNFDPMLLNRPISMGKILQRDVNLLELLAKICTHIEAQYLRLRSGNFNSLQNSYLSGLYRFKEKASYRRLGEVFEGTIIDVTEQGLLVMLSNGIEKHYNFKEVEFLNNI
ncbi:BirA family transcriptional regulator, biotin operon repressor / biotin-[acetyl-CoA-carboxylase] ligase [Pedobacter nyackensis]|uniref:BirA family transcriptional regulator, biotin operon repressor / biotin-[acetyl-CoA-carboxylase] ligase n=1 Tax=Pedobacter nyackensis TaxID=475255 RepID=A0A1W2BMW2_9SPHI|nr:BirA family transcriptional regulator, biotin operon repressor / biotin-[acetyl-CoA-carboxylase] ligase [Pedobacter nyackensis]